MKKIKYLLMILVFISTFISCSTNSINNSLSEQNLKGNIKILKEFSYKAISKVISDSIIYLKRERDREKIYEKYPEDISHNKDHISNYNTIGNIINITLFTDSDDLIGKLEYKYDKHNRKTRQIIYNDDGITKRMIKNYVYDKLNNIVEQRLENPNGSPYGNNVYTFNKRAQKILTTGYKSGEGIKYKKCYKYYKNNNLLEFELYHSFNDKYGSGEEGCRFTKETYKYNIHNRLIFMEVWDCNDKLYETTEYEYNDYGLVMKEININNSNTDSTIDALYNYTIEVRYLYTYDKEGNWITQIKLEKKTPNYETKYENGKFIRRSVKPEYIPKYYTERIIEYYN